MRDSLISPTRRSFPRRPAGNRLRLARWPDWVEARVQPLPDVTITDEKTMRRAVAAAAIGNVTEWYDFGVYAYLVPTLTKVFFSGLPQSVAIIYAFATFAVSFLVRPIGGLIF